MYIYALVDPETNEVRYVGATKSLRKRLYQHVNPKAPKSTSLQHWIGSLQAKHLQPSMITLEEIANDQWEEAERKWIAYYRQEGTNLVNVLSGGKIGTSEALRELWQAPEYREQTVNRLKKENRSPAYLERASEAQKKRYLDPETRERQRQIALKASKASQEKHKSTPWGRGRTKAAWTPERRAAFSEKAKQSHSSEEYKAKQSAVMKAIYQAKSHKEN